MVSILRQINPVHNYLTNTNTNTPEILILQKLHKVSYEGFTAMCSKGKPVTGSMIIEKAMSFYYEVKKTHKCTFSDGWQSSNKKLPARNLISTGKRQRNPITGLDRP